MPSSTQASMQVRRNRISRHQAITIVNKIEGKYPSTYLGKPLSEILNEIDMTIEEFENICLKFTNKSIFLKDNEENLIKDNHGNLIKTNIDNV